MSYTFFYVSVIITVILFIYIAGRHTIDVAIALTGISSIAYSLVFEITFGHLLGLYYYIGPSVSVFYILIASIFIYPIFNMLYVIYLPKPLFQALVYTTFWICSMLIFEYLSVITKTVVFSGWKPFPWSIVTYIVTYTWVNTFYRYLKNRVFEKRLFKQY